MALKDNGRYSITKTGDSKDVTRKSGILESIKKWWDNLADPAKTHVPTTQEVYRNTRDNIVLMIVFAVAIILMRKLFPTLFVGLGITEALALISVELTVREAIRNGDNLREVRREAEKDFRRLISSYVIAVILLTVLALWIKHGAQWANDLPFMHFCAERQIEMLSETVDFIRKLF